MINEKTLDDRTIKWIGIPALGLLIPNLSGLITNRLYTYPELLACYAYFTLIALLIWQGNVWFMYFIRKRYTWSYKQYYKIVLALFLINIVYSGLLSTLLLNLWKMVAREPYEQGAPLINTSLIIIIAACFITNIY